MYVIVRYGEKQEAIFNPNCKNVLLLNTIREKCMFSEDVELEVSDEVGNVKNLREVPMGYATDVLHDRERLVLLRVDIGNKVGETKYVPLLTDTESINENFLAQLASRANLGRPGSQSSLRRRSPNPTGKSRDKNRNGNGNKAKNRTKPK